MAAWIDQAHEVIRRCRELALATEEPGHITRTFLSPPMQDVHRRLEQWLQAAGLKPRLDTAGNLRAYRSAATREAPVLYLGSHIDSVPHAGAFDGVLGVVLAIALVEALAGRKLPYAIEVIAFSEEEGIRFGVPFIGSRALVGTLDADLLARRDDRDITVAEAIRQFGLDPGRAPEATIRTPALGFLEFHIEQGPVLEELAVPLGIVNSICGQSRLNLTFTGQANHAGTTPHSSRRDALVGAAEWITRVERQACTTPGLRATVGRLGVQPGASNVVPGLVHASLDVRHPDDIVRLSAVESLLAAAEEIASHRNLRFASRLVLDQPAVPLDTLMIAALERAVARAGFPCQIMPSGAGHDAMIMAQCCPAAMLFLRSPGGISHHPAETVLPEDVAAALAVGFAFFDEAEALCA